MPGSARLSMQEHQVEMSQAEFARDLGVSRAAVSQWKAKDILREDAFTKPGKNGKLIYHLAVEQVRRNRDVGQALANGLATKTTATPHPQAGEIRLPDAPLEHEDQMPQRPTEPTVEDQIKQARLEQQLRANRQQAVEEARSQQALMSTEDVRVQMTKTASMALRAFEGALTDLATAISERFNVPQRDVLHLLKAQYSDLRLKVTEKQKAEAARLSRTRKVEI